MNNVHRVFGLAFLIVGIVLLAVGVHATGSFGQKVVKEFQGTYSNATMWYIIGGCFLILVGGGLLFIRRK